MRGEPNSLTVAQKEAQKRGYGPLTDEAARMKLAQSSLAMHPISGNQSEADPLYSIGEQAAAPIVRSKVAARDLTELKVVSGELLPFDKSALTNLSFSNDLRYTQSYESGTESRVLGESQDFDPIRRATALGKMEEVKYLFRGATAEVVAVSQEVQIGGHTVNVVYPKTPVVLAQGLATPSLDSVVKALGVVEDLQLSELRTVALNPNQNPSDAYWAKEYNKPDFRSAATAGGGVINFYPAPLNNSSQSIVDATMIHEAGHLWSAKLWQSESVKQAWVGAISSDARLPSTYAKSAPTEDFSEALVMYRMSKGRPMYEPTARQLFPARYGILDSLHAPPPARRAK